jgi:flagellar M-ring protein FliF
LERVRVTLNDWSNLIRYVALIGLFLLTYALLLRPMKKQVLKTLRDLPANVISGNAKLGSMTGEALDESEIMGLPPERQRNLVLKKRMIDKVKSEPIAASQLVQAWIHEEAK